MDEDSLSLVTVQLHKEDVIAFVHNTPVSPKTMRNIRRRLRKRLEELES